MSMVLATADICPHGDSSSLCEICVMRATEENQVRIIRELRSENAALKARVELAKTQLEDVKEVLNAESKYNEEQNKLAGCKPGEFVMGGRYEVNAAMYRLSLSAEKFEKALTERSSHE